jgi:diguanylate cyclase (GGDEF)-like protein
MKTEYFQKKVLDSIPTLLSYWDKDAICRFANHAFFTWFGIRGEDMVDKMTTKEVFGSLYELNLPFWKASMEGHKQEFKRDIVLPNGEIRHAIATYLPDFIKGRVVGVIVQVADNTYLQQLEDELVLAKNKAEYLATHDHLTGLPNRVLLKDRIHSSLLFAKRRNKKVAVCMLDIDNFKNINDDHGHQAGDEILRRVAEGFQSSLRDYDSIARLGGDEFVLLLSNFSNVNEIVDTITRVLRDNTNSHFFDKIAIPTSFSLGASIFPEHGTSVEELLSNADQALYAAKRNGKNSFRFFQNCV